MKRKITKNSKFSEGINYALEGIATAIKTERNMRLHIFVAMLVIILSLIFGVTGSDLKSLSFAISTKYHPLAKKAKDVAAGAVLVVSLNSLVIGYIIFSKKIKQDTYEIFGLLKSSYVDTVLFVLFIVIIGVFVIKSYYKRGKLLHGGMPSGHSALAFGLWVGVSYATENIVVTILTFGMALLVAQSRIEGRIHSPKEVLAGSILGTFVTYILLKLIF